MQALQLDETDEQFRIRLAQRFPLGHRCDLTCADFVKHEAEARSIPESAVRAELSETFGA